MPKEDREVKTRMYFVMDDVQPDNIITGDKGELYYYENPEVNRLSKTEKFRETLTVKVN